MSTRPDGRGHWPRGKTRHAPPDDWRQLLRTLNRLLRSPQLYGRAPAPPPAQRRSRSGLAAACGVADTQVGRWLRGEDVPSPRSVKCIRAWIAEQKGKG